jgi:ferritin-like protein
MKVEEAAGSLAEALAAEHAAIFGYGVVGAHLDRSGQTAARQAEAAHRNRRDAVAARIRAAQGTPPAPAPAYDLPFPVEDRASALRLAIDLEEGTARAWRRAVAGTTGDDRKAALAGLVDSAVRATRWRRTAGLDPAVVPFPGAPA